MSETKPAAFAAFISALAEMQNPAKNAVVKVPGKYTFEYADLASILDAVRPVLGRHALGLIQPVNSRDGQLIVSTSIIHSSGEVVAASEIAVAQPRTPQEVGSLVTYLRRYQISSLLGIAADDDDDGASAAGMTAEVARRAPPAPREPAFDSRSFVAAALAETGIPLDAFEGFLSEKGKTTAGLSKADAEKCVAWALKPETQKQVAAYYFGEDKADE